VGSKRRAAGHVLASFALAGLSFALYAFAAGIWPDAGALFRLCRCGG